MIFKKFKLKFFSFFFFLFVILFFFFFLQKNKYEIVNLKINDVEFFVELADTPYKKGKGLGDRDFLCDKCGMLFIFSEKSQHSFWMKDMKFDLDILWIRDDEIVFIQKNVSNLNQEVIYKPEVESDFVLELNSGIVEKFGFVVGDKIEIENDYFFKK